MSNNNSNNLRKRSFPFHNRVYRRVEQKTATEIEPKVSWFSSVGAYLLLPQPVSKTAVISVQPLRPTALLKEELEQLKNTLASIEPKKFEFARARANPFEKIGKEMFINRSALKLAELDAILQKRLTRPPDSSPSEVIYFADLCGGPGGFTEYLLSARPAAIRGFGITLRGPIDYRVQAEPEEFRKMYGADGTGDILRADNRDHFIRQVLAETTGVHLVVADGAFSVQGRENEQEVLSVELIAAEIMVGLSVLRVGGNFICKIFDSFLPETVELLCTVAEHFQGFGLVKPNQSRPANSEKYFIGIGLQKKWQPQDKKKEEEEEQKKKHDSNSNRERFREFMDRFNQESTQKQIEAVRQIRFYADHPAAKTRVDQEEIRSLSLQFWDIGQGGAQNKK